MATKKAKPKRVRKSTVSTEFLVQTLASIQSALASIDKESSAKTEALGAVLDNINGMAEMMKLFHDQNIRDANKILELDGEIRALRTETRLLNSGDDIKEIKYKIEKMSDEKLQKISDDILAMKTARETKAEIKNQEDNDGPKRWNLFTFFKDLATGLNNVKTILIVVLVIIMLIASLLFGPSVIQTFVDILKNVII